MLYKQGEKLYLEPDIERMAALEQTAALESDVREGMIAEYLEKLLPDDWDRMDLAERRGFLRGDQFTGGNRTGTERRKTVSAVEVWAECFGKDPTTIKRSDTYDIFGMLMKIGGWEKYSGNKSGVSRRSFSERSGASSECKPVTMPLPSQKVTDFLSPSLVVTAIVAVQLQHVII